MDWVTLIGLVVALATALLKAYVDNTPERKEKARNAQIEQGREDLTGGNVAAVEQRIDSMLAHLPEGDGDAGSQDGAAQGGTSGPV